MYRGAPDATWSLLTSLDSLGGVHPPHAKAELEEHALRNFIRYSRPYFPTPPVNEWELLISAQHHGLPTRRLDWKLVHRYFKRPELALSLQDLEGLFGGQRPFTPWTLLAEGRAGRQFACMIEPPSLNPRITVQSATFTLCSDKWQPFDRFLEAHGRGATLTKFVIPVGEVARVRDQLDLAGIDERRLFPDLDSVAAQMRRYYS